MDEFERQLQRRLEVLSDAVPLRAAPAAGRPVAGRSSPVRRGWSPGVGGLAAFGLVLAVASIGGLLFLGGSISGVLQNVGGGIPAPPPGYIGTVVRSIDGDIPCGTDGEHCATPLPTIDPAVVPRAMPLRVASASVTVDRVGHYSVPLGTAILPNGIVTDATVTLEEPMQPSIRLEPSAVYLVVTGDDGKPLQGVYGQRWRPGTEQVTVSLEFDVTSVATPVTLEFTDIVVR